MSRVDRKARCLIAFGTAVAAGSSDLVALINAALDSGATHSELSETVELAVMIGVPASRVVVARQALEQVMTRRSHGLQ